MIVLDGILTNKYVFLDGGRYQILPMPQRPISRTHPFCTLVARDLLTGRLVVIKRLNMTAISSHQAWEKAHETLRREIMLLQRLVVPYTAKILDSFCEDSQLNAIIEYVPGKAVEEHLDMCRRRQTKIYTEAEVIDFGLQIYGILSGLHTLRPAIIHRDVKPGNIIQRPDGVYVLIDFGNAREYGSLRSLTRVNQWKISLADTIQGVGTIGYAPPEQYPGWHGRPYVHTTPVSDLYGPAVCMHQMLTGKNPTTKDRQKQFSFSSLDDYACPALVELIGQALQQDEHKRPQSASEVVQRLLAIQMEHWARYQTPHVPLFHPVLTS